MDETTFNNYLEIIESKTDLHFSDEQIDVLKYNYQSPVLLNSCAGAGKTTLLIVSIVMQMLDGVEPQNILAITFSRAARADMQKKFAKVMTQLDVHPQSQPNFKTFDALFLYLLKCVDSNFRVTDDNYEAKHLNKTQKQLMKYHHGILSDDELLKEHRDFREQIINQEYSYDGYHQPNSNKPLTVKELTDIAHELNVDHPEGFYRDNLKITKAYLDQKNQHRLIDFHDLKIKLLKYLANPETNRIIKNAMEQYQQVFIDEFQDINSLQWNLIKTLLSKTATEHLAMIGDDDQSIYSFRGSNPDIILNLNRHIPNLKTFNLTINYRTAGQILQYVTPLIKINSYRLPKDLNVFKGHQNDGKLIEYQGNYNQSGKTLLMEKLIQKLKDPKIPNAEIAVLCRNNIDIKLGSDILANQGFYLNVRKESNILQNDSDYKSFLGIMESLIRNRFTAFYKNAAKIGFIRYKTHIDDILKYYHKDKEDIKTLSDYLDLAETYDDNRLDYDEFYDRQNAMHDHNMMRGLNEVDDLLKDSLNPHNGHDLYMTLDTIVRNYYKYMGNHNYIDINRYAEILEQVRINLFGVSDLTKWLYSEANKRKKLTRIVKLMQDEVNYPKDETPASFLTIHASKGLEFNYVYMYNPRANGISKATIRINQLFKPNLTKLEFINLLKQNIGDEFKLYTKDYHKIYEVNQKFNHYYEIVKNLDQVESFIDTLTGKIHPEETIPLVQQFNQIYYFVTSQSHNVEDERRLLYVALTRSIKDAYYSYDVTGTHDTSSPLITELTTPLNNKLYMDDDQTITNEAKELGFDDSEIIHSKTLTPEQIKKRRIQALKDKLNRF